MDSWKLTVTFSDGEAVIEKFVTKVGMERAMRWWEDAATEDKNNGSSYTIVSMEPEELEPVEV